MMTMKKTLLVFGLSLGLTSGLVGMAQASALDDARAKGFVCEAANGLLKATGGGGDIKNLVKATNSKRMKLYQDTASKEGVPVTQIQAVSGAKLQKKYPACK
jgi:uncharacterized protein YdbL (DUF1318 family)